MSWTVESAIDCKRLYLFRARRLQFRPKAVAPRFVIDQGSRPNHQYGLEFSLPSGSEEWVPAQKAGVLTLLD